LQPRAIDPGFGLDHGANRAYTPPQARRAYHPAAFRFARSSARAMTDQDDKQRLDDL
jgi:hypothetical protein